MTRTEEPISTVARTTRRHPRRILALTSLAALALTACGTERAHTEGAQRGPADGIRADAAAAQPRQDPLMDFLNMQSTVLRTCLPDAPSSKVPAEEALPEDEHIAEKTRLPARERPRSVPVPLPRDEEPPPGADPTTPPHVELGPVEECEGHVHGERITKAFSTLPNPTVARIRKTLNALGYPDARIHGLERTGTTVRFFIDLRFMGGHLCLDGSVTGTRTVVEAFGTREVGPFNPGERTH